MNPPDDGSSSHFEKVCRSKGRSAEAVLRKALELTPQNARVRIELGALYEDRGKLAQAAAEFERAIAIDPKHGGSYCQLGRICRKQGRVPEAEAALRKALELDPGDGWARIELGTFYQGQNRDSEAAAEFEKAIAIDGTQGWVHCQLGRIYRRQGRSSEAESALRRAVELDPQNSWTHLEMGALYLDQNRLSEAATELEKAVAIEAENGQVHCQLGRVYRRQGRLSDAEAALRKALEFDPQNGWVCMELGDLYQVQDRFPEAEVEFRKALATDPHNVGVYLRLGEFYLRWGRCAEAEAEFQRAAALCPRNDGAYVGLYAVYRGQGRLPEAEAALAQALAINPRSASAYVGLMDRLERDRLVGDYARQQMREGLFCLLPWTHLHVRANGACWPCCSWNGPPLGDARSSSFDELWNSPGMKALRLDMMSGRPVAGCWRCYELEQSGFESLRQKNNIDLGRHRGRERWTAPDGTLPRLPVPYLDIRFSNICNLRCRICDTTQSSAWVADARALGLPVEGEGIRKSYADWDALWRLLQPLLQEGLEEIAFLGGEPLIMEEHYRVLDFLIAQGLTDVRLNYITNFSTLRFQGRDVLGLWSRFPDVHVAASLDGSGRRGEYMRKGLRWDQVVANREEMLRRCPDVAFSVPATLSIFNALHLPDFHREWVEKGYIDRNAFGLNMLGDPAMYRVEVLPAALKERVLESYRRHRESFLDAGGAAARDFAAAQRFMEEKDCSELLPDFVAMTRRLDHLRGEDCREVFPELAELFEAAA